MSDLQGKGIVPMKSNRRQRKSVIIFKNDFGIIEMPSVSHKDRAFGGHLMISPSQFCHYPHKTSDLLREHSSWFYGYHLLCAVAEKAMLTVLPSLNGTLDDEQIGVINLFEAGNWQLHIHRRPFGKKKDASSKHVHAHMYGRSPLEPCSTPEEKSLHWGWGEAPVFPEFWETPFSPKRKGKTWKIPEGFNEEEITALQEESAKVAASIKWPKNPENSYDWGPVKAFAGLLIGFSLLAGLFILLHQMEWYRCVLQFFDKYPIILIAIFLFWYFGFIVIIDITTDKIPKFLWYLLFIIWILIGAVWLVTAVGFIPAEWESRV